MDICLLLLVVDDDVVISVVTHLSLSDQQESQWMVWCWLWCSIGNTIYAMMHYTPYAHHCCLFCLFVCLLSGECDPFDMPMLISVVHQLSGSIVFRIKTISHSLWYWPVIDIDRFWWRERERESRWNTIGIDALRKTNILFIPIQSVDWREPATYKSKRDRGKKRTHIPGALWQMLRIQFKQLRWVSIAMNRTAD